MRTHTNTLHRHATVLLAICIAAAITPSTLDAVDTPHEIDFVLTAYYSPLPDQCCYVKGSYDADRILNGNGTHGADGTPVYPGMLAAPPSYAFGTRIVLPGLGTMTVHDRGGAIQVLEDGAVHRLDVWAGAGEEGLARALAFGVKRIRGTVYPAGTGPAESFSLASLPAPEEKLKPYFVADSGLIGLRPSVGDAGFSVRLLQESLTKLGYFDHAVTGLYGDVTKQSLQRFLHDVGAEESADALTDRSAALLTAAVQLVHIEPQISLVDRDASAAAIMEAQRSLRFLGFYRGRTDGRYTETLFQAILKYQQEHRLVGDATSPGAGRIGPLTRQALAHDFRQKRIVRRADDLLLYARVRAVLQEKQLMVDAMMQKGVHGAAVRRLQHFLATHGFFPTDSINGNFGDRTEAAVRSYQLARGLLAQPTDTGAGTVGPITLQSMRQEQLRSAYRVVRSEGIEAL